MHNKRIGREDVLKIEVRLKDIHNIAYTDVKSVGENSSISIVEIRHWPRSRPPRHPRHPRLTRLTRHPS